jgi:uncharacterized protein
MDVIHNERLSRFEAPVAGGVGYLQYRIEAGTALLLYVEVPPQARGQGVAAELTRAALAYSSERGLKVIPICSYVAAYLRRHPAEAPQTDAE